MKRLVIFGAGQIGQVAHYYFTEDSPYTPVAFTMDASFIEADSVFDLPVVPFEEIERRFPPGDCDLFVAMGYGKLNQSRQAKVAEARAKGYDIAHYVSSRAWVWNGFEAKDNLFLLEHNTVQPFVSIGENTTVWSGNHFGHHAQIGSNVFIASHVVISGAVTVGDNCFIGVNATIRDNVTVGDRSVLGAGTLLLQDAPEASVYAPAGTEKSKVPSNRLRGL
jgi:sugar O-acyltransferase (sialic acid O-acetyltransferase NeuD family)